MERNVDLKKVAIALALVLAALFSCLFLANRVAAPDLYSKQVASLDDKAETVLKLTATATLASAGVSAIPGDTATPIANKLADFSEYFLLILCVLYSEKYLLTIIPVGACRYLVPLVCALFAVGRFVRGRGLDRLGWKLLLVTLGVSLIIPLSVGASDMIYDAYRQSIDSTITAAEELTEETSELTGAAEDKGVLANILNRLSETAETLTNKASNILNRFVETLAVMIVTSCIIPLLVLLFFLWVLNKISGVDMIGQAFRREPRPMDRRPDDREG